MKPAQRLVSRSIAFYVVPVCLVLVVLADLGWELVRANLDATALTAMGFAPTTLGVAPAASLVGILGALLLARSQYAMVNRPHIAGNSEGWERGKPGGPHWRMVIHNAGAGVARVTSLTFSLAYDGSATAGGLSSAELREQLRLLGFRPDRDYTIRDVSPGLPLRSGADASDGIQIFQLSRPVANRLDSFGVTLQFRDSLGDGYQWTREFAALMKEPG
jgi:hypothetical protein